MELKISTAWANLMLYARTEIRHGQIKIKIVNGQPTELLEEKKNVRFDKPDTLPIREDNNK